MTGPTTPQAILDRWARAPLDYLPGTKWQYSNTGYVAAGLIAEQVAGESLQALLQRRIFEPLGMEVGFGTGSLRPTDTRGTVRYALGPVRPGPGEQPGWLFAAGELALTPTELAKWNIARIRRTVLAAKSWQLQEDNVAPADAGFQYGLGVYLGTAGGHARVRHGGALTSWLSENRVYPADQAAISVFINAGFSNSQDAIADAIEAVLFGTSVEVAEARASFEALRTGGIDRARFTDNGNFYFTPAVLADYRASLVPLGTLEGITALGKPGLRGGLTTERYLLAFASRKLLAVVRREPGTGRIEQYALYPYSD
jgi:CubicO group peptidase (beta-lactamase class C family)